MNIENYFLVPISLLRNLVKDKNKALNDMINYGIYQFSKRIQSENYGWEGSDVYNGARQLMYCYYRRKQEIPTNLLNRIEYYVENGSICLYEDYSGFLGYKFEPEFELEQIMELVNTDNVFRDEIIEFGKTKSVYFLMQIKGNFEETIKRAKAIEKKIDKNEPMVMVNRDLAFEYRDNEKTEFELMTFAVSLGIRSILGKKPYCKTTKQMIFSRAFGFRNYEELQKNKPELFDKFFNRWQTDKLLNEIETGNWNILRYSSNRMRGLYVGYKRRISYEDLIMEVEKKQQSNKALALKNKKKALREKALKELNLQHPNDILTTS